MLKLDFILDDRICDIESRHFWESLPVQEVLACVLQYAPVWKMYRSTASNVCVRVTDPATMCQYNEQHRHKKSSTNILSFPVMPPGSPFFKTPDGRVILGDLLISHADVACQAKDQGKTIAQHATHLLVHGMLHLLHYDHVTADQAKVMEDLERVILSHWGWPCPY